MLIEWENPCEQSPGPLLGHLATGPGPCRWGFVFLEPHLDTDPEFQGLEKQPDLYGGSVSCPQRRSFLQSSDTLHPGLLAKDDSHRGDSSPCVIRHSCGSHRGGALGRACVYFYYLFVSCWVPWELRKHKTQLECSGKGPVSFYSKSSSDC